MDADSKNGSVIIAHGPIASLKWGGMTMGFRVADAGLFAALKEGAQVRFEFIEQPPGEWTVVRATPLAEARDSAAPDPHKGH